MLRNTTSYDTRVSPPCDLGLKSSFPQSPREMSPPFLLRISTLLNKSNPTVTLYVLQPPFFGSDLEIRRSPSVDGGLLSVVPCLIVHSLRSDSNNIGDSIVFFVSVVVLSNPDFPTCVHTNDYWKRHYILPTGSP